MTWDILYKLGTISDMEKNMNIKKILKNLFYVLLSILAIIVLVHFSLESDFAKVNSDNKKVSDAGYKIKTKYYKELYYSTKFKRNTNNENILSLGYFTVNINNKAKNNKLMIKVTVEIEEGVIDSIMSNQSVIRNDVIDSVINLKSSSVNPENVSTAIQNNLNKRLRSNVVKDVYFEEFIIQ